MHLRFVSPLIISGLRTIARQQAATGLVAAPDQWLRADHGRHPRIASAAVGRLAKASKRARLRTVTDADRMSIPSSPEPRQAMRALIADGR